MSLMNNSVREQTACQNCHCILKVTFSKNIIVLCLLQSLFYTIFCARPILCLTNFTFCPNNGIEKYRQRDRTGGHLMPLKKLFKKIKFDSFHHLHNRSP